MVKNETSPATSLSDAEREAIGKMSFETAMKDLEAIVRKLESGNGELEGTIADYARGMALKDHCMKKLAGAKLQVETLMQSENGSLVSKSFEPNA